MILTRLIKGKALGAFPNFVDSWNFICDFVENLRGDADTDAAKGILLDRNVEDHPVIRLSDDYQPGGGSGGARERIEITADSTCNVKFEKYDSTDDDGTVVHHLKLIPRTKERTVYESGTNSNVVFANYDTTDSDGTVVHHVKFDVYYK